MVRKDKKIVAVDLFVDLFMSFVFHIIWIFWGYAVNNDLFIKLDSKSILVDGDLLDVVSAPDFDSGLSDQVLNDNISHELSVGISLLV